jgi:hypothetical protein
LHWQETMDHGVQIVHVPDPRVLHFYYISGDYWPQDGPESWMGRQINVVTDGRPMQLRIIGRMRPPELGPVEIRVVNGSEVLSYRIAQPDTQLLTLPANASVVLTANTTFVPARFIHNRDERHLSVAIDLQPQ